MNRHVWQVVAAVGVTLMAYAWAADEGLYTEVFTTEVGPELFAIGAGALTAGLLFWRDPPSLPK